MKPDKIKALLPLLGSQATGARTGWVLGRCPMLWKHQGLDANPSFAVSHDPKKRSRVKCLSCGYSGDLTDVLMDITYNLKKYPELKHKYNLAAAASMVNNEFEEMELTAADIPDFEEAPPKTETLFPEQWLATFMHVQKFDEPMAYLTGRGLSLEVIQALDVRYDAQKRRVGFPFRNFKGELMGMQGRIIDPPPDPKPEDWLPYYQYGYNAKRNAHIWMGEDKLNLDYPVVVCEGPFDFAAIMQVYPNVAASFTSGLSRTKCRRLADAEDIITFYDYGKGGDAARESLRKYLPKHALVDIIPTQQEDDAGSMSTETIVNYLSEHLSLE